MPDLLCGGPCKGADGSAQKGTLPASLSRPGDTAFTQRFFAACTTFRRPALSYERVSDTTKVPCGNSVPWCWFACARAHSPREIGGCAVLHADLVALHLQELAVLASVVDELHASGRVSHRVAGAIIKKAVSTWGGGHTAIFLSQQFVTGMCFEGRVHRT